MSSIVDIIQAIVFIIDSATSSYCSIKFIFRLASLKNLSHTLIVGTIGGGNTINWMEAPSIVIVELLQVKDLEIALFLVVERHGVSHPSDGRLPICVVTVLLGRSETFGCCGPVFFRISHKMVFAT